jgi:hypothetical protein
MLHLHGANFQCVNVGVFSPRGLSRVQYGSEIQKNLSFLQKNDQQYAKSFLLVIF